MPTIPREHPARIPSMIRLACAPCVQGLGRTVRFNMDRVLDMKKSLNEGAIQLPGFQIGTYQWQMYANSGRFDPDKPLEDYTEEEMDFFSTDRT